MADQKLGLVGHGVLERLAEVDVEMADRVALDLAARSGRRVAKRGLGGGHGVLVADAEEDRAGHLARRAPRAVEPDAVDEPGRHPALELHARWDQRVVDRLR